MEEAIQKIAMIFEEQLPSVEVTLTEKKNVHKIGGLLSWSGFAGKSQLDRQETIWKLLRERLNENELSKVGTILTVSPAELAANEETAAIS